MTLVFAESFDGVADPTYLLGKGWTNFTSTPSLPAGRHGNCIRNVNSFALNGIYNIPAASEHATVVVGFAFRTNTLGRCILTIWASESTNTGVSIGVNSSGKITIAVRSNPTVALVTGGISEATLLANTWHWIEVKATIATSGGSVVVRVDGLQGAARSGNTQDGGDAFARRIAINEGVVASNPSGVTVDYDDLIVANAAGTVNNDWFGDTTVDCIRPNGNGASSGFTGSDLDAVDNYLLVDEQAVSDADYVQADAVDEKDTYAYTARSATGVVRGVQHVVRAAWIDAAMQFRHVARLSAVEEESATKSLTNLFAIYAQMLETKPGGGAWGTADVDAAEFGQVAKA